MSRFIQVTEQVSWSSPGSLAFDLDPKIVFGANVKAPRIFVPRSQTREDSNGLYLSEWILRKKVEVEAKKLRVSEANLQAAIDAITGNLALVEDSPQEIEAHALLALFDKAAGRVKYPKVSFGEGDASVKFTRSGIRASQPYTVNVTDGKPFGENKWFGRIERDGKFKPSSSCTQEVIDQIEAFNLNPARYSAERGRESGNCVYCRQTLSDNRSLSVGYGKTCSGTYGLPWGK